jgi:hypothetical protein
MSNNYAGMRRRFGDDEEALNRCAQRLLALRAALAPIRAQRTADSMLLATWNIRDFDDNKFRFGPRKRESYYYLAEVIATFDLVAVQEINRNLTPLRDLVEILGPRWDYIVTDATEGKSGNSERMAFLFNRDTVYFRKIAGEVVLPQGQTIVSADRPRHHPLLRPRAMASSRAPRSWWRSARAGSSSACAPCTSTTARSPARNLRSAWTRSRAW